MPLKKQSAPLLQRWKRDTRGQFAMIWGLSSMIGIVGFGAAYDMAQFSKVRADAQSMADAMALAASIAVENDDANRFQEGQKYKYKDVVGIKKERAKTLRAEVFYDIVDDQDPLNAGLPDEDKSRLIARSKVTGKYQPAFMTMFGHNNKFKIEVISDVAYSLSGGQPASVFFAVDNSGSMDWNDANGVNKLVGLKGTMQNFMTQLDGVNTAANNIFRSALYPFNSDPQWQQSCGRHSCSWSFYQNGKKNDVDNDGIINTKDVLPHWGTLTSNEINAMAAGGGTYSAGALQEAAQDFTTENAAHFAANGDTTPLKYMIFMSDGANNATRECVTEQVWVPPTEEYWLDTYYYPPDRYTTEQDWFDRWVDHYPARPGYYEDQETCSVDYHADTKSLAACEQMKNDGVTVYTIGYHLIAGTFNGYTVDQAEVNRANTLLQQCASPGKNVSAANAAELQEVLDEIGEEIIEEVIRIKR